MREAYHSQLAALTDEGAAMCRMATEAMRDAHLALMRADLSLAEIVIDRDRELDRMRGWAEEAVLQLLALQAPVATDLRGALASLWMASDAQRMGTLAIHVAKAVRRRHPDSALTESVRLVFEQMGTVAVALGQAAARCIADRDVALAMTLDSDDDAMDRLHRELFAVLMSPEWSDGIPAAVDISLRGRFYERFADHAVAIARRVVFTVTGRNVGGDTTVTNTPR
jgi:phosphate transport system protein